MAGIVAGDGTASRGTFTGVAPGASLYGFGVGEGISVFSNAEAYDYMIRNYDSFSPRIRVVNNSYGDGAGSAYEPGSVFSKLTRDLLAKGVTIVFAAGNGDDLNNGGTGSDDRLSSTAKDPTPGVVTVANYDDGGTGSKSGTLDFSSSRGHRGFPTTYPDLSAPGALITATCNAALSTCAPSDLAWAPHYSTLSGTSMASPHVAGIAAMLYQARPELTPAQVEDVLQDTAHKYGDATTYEADPQNAGGTVAFDKGAGLADATAALDALGVSHDGGETSSGTPSVVVTAPAEGAESDGTAPIAVSGTVDDGYVAPAPFVRQRIVDGDRGDIPAELPQAADIASLAVTERTEGLRVELGLGRAQDVGPAGSVLLVVAQTLNGAEYQSRMTLRLTNGLPTATASAFNATTNNAVATQLAVTNDVVSFLLPFGTAQGAVRAPSPMSAGYSSRAWSFTPTGYPADVAPGGLGAEIDARPEYGAAHTVRRPSVRPVPVATATVSVDGGPEQPAVLAGSSPGYEWSALVDPSGLSDGPHAVTARLYLDGVLAATDAVGIAVRRPVLPRHAIAITSPEDGATLPRGVVTVAGTAETNAPSTSPRHVTVQVVGAGYDSGEQLADGVTAWALPLDVAALAAGSYALTTRLHVDGVAVASATRSVVVPLPPIGCAPEGLTFWQSQYDGSRPALTSAEANAVADRAVARSDGYFKDRQSLLNVLYVKGRLPAETTAARQYAVLLLNLAAGELTPTMSRKVGLSGAERLDPRWYDTATLGSTAGSAAAWVAEQLPSGDLAGANSVATALNKGVGLAC